MDNKRMNMNRLKKLVPLILLIISVVFVFFTRVTSLQAVNPIPAQLHMKGEYCYGDGPWMPLDENTKFDKREDVLKLRGMFDVVFPQSFVLNLKTDHLNVTMKINDEVYFVSSVESEPVGFDMCGRGWLAVMLPGFSEDDVVEFELKAVHRERYTDVFDNFADNLFCGEKMMIQAALLNRNLLYFIGGALAAIAGLSIMGGAAAVANTKTQMWYPLLIFGGTTVITGIFVFFNAPDINLWSDRLIFNTNVEIVSMMLAVFGYQTLFTMIIPEKRRKPGEWASTLSCLSVVIFIILDAANIICLYDAVLYWRIFQGILCLILLAVHIYEVRANKEWRKDSIWFALIFMVLIVDFINASTHWWPAGGLTLIIVMVIIMLYLKEFITSIHRNFHMAHEAKNLKKELEISRVTLAMSQIKHHFIFNVLNAISGLCKYDPKKADETVVRFARYLRSNIDIIEEDKNIPFIKELEHLLDYIMLEQIRFGDKIKFETDIETEDFMIPPLILQPLAENAVKHGIMKKDGSGNIKMTVRREEKNIIITMEDDGAGFDTAAEVREGAVGIKNIRFRLKVMINGELHMSSVPGEGTCAVIKLPVTEEIL